MAEWDAEEFDFERMYEEEMEMMRDQLLCKELQMVPSAACSFSLLQVLALLQLHASPYLSPAQTFLLEQDGRGQWKRALYHS